MFPDAAGVGKLPLGLYRSASGGDRVPVVCRLRGPDLHIVPGDRGRNHDPHLCGVRCLQCCAHAADAVVLERQARGGVRVIGSWWVTAGSERSAGSTGSEGVAGEERELSN